MSIILAFLSIYEQPHFASPEIPASYSKIVESTSNELKSIIDKNQKDLKEKISSVSTAVNKTSLQTKPAVPSIDPSDKYKTVILLIFAS